MSFYSDASLVMIPSGYKASKVYSAKPTDGTGDLTFTRSNDTATRFGPDGLIQRVRTNLMTYSEDWTNAAWTKTNATVTANATTNPIDGATTADAIFETTTNGQHNFFQIFSAAVGTEVTISFYAKANGRTKLRMNNGSSAITAAFDLTAVTASMLAGTGTPTITSVGSGWYRCSIRYNALNANEYVAMNFRDDTNQDTYAGDITKGMFFFGAQAETGVLTSYIATTTAAVSVGPVANVPRLDYLNSSCPRLLLEPQRVNLAQFSEFFDNAYWTKNAVTISANTATSPDGYTNADKIEENTTNTNHRISVGFSFTGPITYTGSCFLKAAERSIGYLYVGTSAFGGDKIAYFNLANGTIGTTSSGTTAKIEDYGNGWYRCSVTATSVSGALSAGFNIGVSQADGVFSYAGTTGSGILAWGAQLEASASYPSSYIPTLGAAVTRGADTAEKDGISSLISSATGTAFIDVQETNNPSGTTNTDILLLQNNANAALGTYSLFLHGSTGNLRIYFLPENISVTVKSGNNRGQRLKVAFAYSSGDFVCYVNGVQVYSASRTLGTGLDKFALNASPNSGLEPVNQALVFKTRLSNSDLAALTTL